MTTVKLVLVDINPAVVRAFGHAFGDAPDVEIVQGNLIAQPVSAWVTPTNARASMDGGLDAVVRRHLGSRIQARVRRQVVQQFGGEVPVGYATVVETGRAQPAYLISAPTMGGSCEDIRESFNVALACGAALQAVLEQNRRAPGSIRSVAVPGLGAGTGRVPPDVCAELMWLAWNVFREQQPDGFDGMRAAIAAELGEVLPGDERYAANDNDARRDDAAAGYFGMSA